MSGEPWLSYGAALLPLGVASVQVALLVRHARKLAALARERLVAIDQIERGAEVTVAGELGVVRSAGPQGAVHSFSGDRCVHVEQRFAAITRETRTSGTTTTTTDSTEWIGQPVIKSAPAELRQGDLRCQVELGAVQVVGSGQAPRRYSYEEFIGLFPDMRASVPTHTRWVELHETRLLDGAWVMLRGLAREGDEGSAASEGGYRKAARAPLKLGPAGGRPLVALTSPPTRMAARSVVPMLLMLGVAAVVGLVGLLSLHEAQVVRGLRATPTASPPR